MDDASRRRYRRYDVEGVDGNFVVRVDVNVINLSVAGMAIETKNTLIVGRPYSFVIGDENKSLEVEGRVMWCVLGKTERANGETAPVFRAGIQFKDVLSEGMFGVQNLIKSSAILVPDNRVFGRFTADLGGVIDPEKQAPFEVKRVSLSGMLIETDLSPRKDEVVPFEARLGDFRFTGHGRVAYIADYEDQLGNTRFNLGIEFALLSERSRIGLEAYLDSLIESDLREGTA